MADDINNEVSQEELDALLGGGQQQIGTMESMPSFPVKDLSGEERKALSDVLAPAMQAAMTSLSTILNKQVDISTPEVETVDPDQVSLDIPGSAIAVEVDYSGGITGHTYLIFLKEQGTLIADIMMGGDGKTPPKEINDLYLGALGEALGQMIDSSAASISHTLGKTVTAAQPKIKIVNFASEQVDLPILKHQKVVKVKYNLKLGDLSSGNLIQLMPVDIAKPIVDNILSGKKTGGETVNAEISPTFVSGVSPVQFASLKSTGGPTIPGNIRLIMDVPMDVTVELGRKKMSVREILDLGVGSIVELDRMTGESVDILANGKLVAKGGVVVIDDTFGVRVTEIIALP
ncbi:flagellar motor switch protein FliN [bacterium]|nr:flagellar motor switch protein FliN [bacterium]MBU1753882.1 flagellar motor switch protein FliN [bacterium]